MLLNGPEHHDLCAARQGLGHDAPVQRVTGADVPMPYNKHLERLTKPSPDSVIAAVKKATYLDGD